MRFLPQIILGIILLAGCQDYPDLLVHLDEVDPEIRWVDYYLSANGRSCNTPIHQDLLAMGPAVRLPLDCLSQGYASLKNLTLRAEALDVDRCIVGVTTQVVDTTPFDIVPVETRLKVDRAPERRCRVSVETRGLGEVTALAANGEPGFVCPSRCEAARDSGLVTSDCVQRCQAAFLKGSKVTVKGMPRYQFHLVGTADLLGDQSFSVLGEKKLAAHFTPGLCTPTDDLCTYNPLAQGYSLNAAARVAGQGIWLAGDNGTLLYYDGRQLAAVPSGTTSDLTGIAASDDGQTVWAVGKEGTILTFSGSAWLPLASQTTANLRGVWVSPNGQQAWIVGDSGTVLQYQGPPEARSRSIVSLPDPYRGLAVLAVHGRTADNVWIAGQGQMLLKYEAGSFVQKSPPITSGTLRAVWVAGNDVLAAGDGGVLLHYNLPAAKLETAPSGTLKNLRAVWGTDADNYWFGGDEGTAIHQLGGSLRIARAAEVGYSNLNAGAVQADGRALIVSSTGGLWTVDSDAKTFTPLSFSGTLEAIWGFEAQDLWAVGDHQILHYSPAGLTVTAQSQYLFSIWGSAANDIWAVGEQGTILHYDGSSWMPSQSGINSRLRGVCGTSRGDVWAVGENGTTIHYDGTGWGRPSTSTNKNLNAVWCGGPDNVWMAGDGGLVLHYVGKSNGFIVSQSYDSNRPRILSIWGDAQGTIYAAGESGTLFELPAGASPPWAQQVFNMGVQVNIHKVFGVSAGRPGVCDKPAAVWLAGENGFLRRRDNNGHWATMTYDDFTDLRSIWADSPCGAWLVGGRGAVLRQVGDLHP
jgi:photosystem II stability/assembly factor-like uncharacterized protein